MKHYEDLQVWKKSIELCQAVYTRTNSLPEKETFGLRSQMTRACVSIASNIAEGSQKTDKDCARFLDMSLGSTAELHTQFVIANSVYGDGLIPDNNYEDLFEIRRMIQGLKKALKPGSKLAPRSSPPAAGAAQ